MVSCSRSWIYAACKQARTLLRAKLDTVIHVANNYMVRMQKRRALLRLSVVSISVLLIVGLILPRAILDRNDTAFAARHIGQRLSSCLGVNDFVLAAEQGFGDRQNTAMWSMQWWPKTGKLYVGTNRSWMCWSFASFVRVFPGLEPFLSYLYPPRDPDIECSEDYTDLALQAEIWAWDPLTDTWERVFQSPQDVPIPDSDKFVARDIGLRSMAVFTEPDGTEALYVSGVTSQSVYGEDHIVPPPRILRTTDGIHFEPIPQDPGTFMGELPKASFRSLTPYQGRLYVIHGPVQGNGMILESANPAAGNNAWRQVSPEWPGFRAYELTEYNGLLYVGRNEREGYSVLKTDCRGEPPYEFTPVVVGGGYLEKPSGRLLSKAILNMHVFDGRLYVGTDKPAELIRVNPDDTWDLVIGTPRLTPDGFKYPLSGLDEGFNWPLNDHIWRMQEHDGALYIGTMDAATNERLCSNIGRVVHDRTGFDLYSSEDGIHFSAVTIDGFGDPFDFGVRTFQSTPHGLFVGTANWYYGAKVYRGTHHPRRIAPLRLDQYQLEPPGRVLATSHPQGVQLSWSASPGAVQYRIFRSTFIKMLLTTIPGGLLPDQLQAFGGCLCDLLTDLPMEVKRLLAETAYQEQCTLYDWLKQLCDLARQVSGHLIPLPGVEIASTRMLSFLDTTIEPGVTYSYYVVAEGRYGDTSGSSNLVTFPLVQTQSWCHALGMSRGVPSGRAYSPLEPSRKLAPSSAGMVDEQIEDKRLRGCLNLPGPCQAAQPTLGLSTAMSQVATSTQEGEPGASLPGPE